MEKEIRTLGDGMDNTQMYVLSPQTNALNLPFVNVDNKLINNKLKSLTPVEPKTKVITLVPKYIPKERKVPKCLIKKPKEPKFIPYEPYKAAVEPIMPSNKVNRKISGVKPSKNNIEIQELVNQMTAMREIEMRKINQIESENDGAIRLKLQWEKEKAGYETDIKNLRETNSHLENQLKFQAQVNGELKTLLVAAVGEDLESRVQHLTEDKLSLARALLNSANHLTSHQEQTEWLSGQCEVWRSKFLASSLMVEELAKWKSALTNRVLDLQEVLKNTLEEHKGVYNQANETYNNLKIVAQKVENKKNSMDAKCGNYIEVTNANNELSECILKSLDLHKEESNASAINKSLQNTVAERMALKLLQHPVSITSKQDALCNAVMGAANSLAGKQMFLQHPSLYGCCPHCKGDAQNI